LEGEAVISIESSGSFANTDSFFARLLRSDINSLLQPYGEEGVRALASATPVESGETARSWTYKVVRSKGSHSIVWSNSHIVEGQIIAILIQYGHGTGTGGFVQGRDYINPAIQPIFDRIAESVWKVVTTNG
jgi:hypothetical protein